MKHRIALLSLVAVLLCTVAGIAPAQEKTPEALVKSWSLSTVIPVDPSIKVGQLDNGVKYYIKKNTKPEKRAELRLAVNVGSVLETEAQRGLAHFVEHMAFNGTKNFKKNELVEYLESIGMRFGGDLNAYTSFDETVYMLTVPTDDNDKLDKGFQILEDWAHNVSFEAEDIDKERGVIIEEWRLGKGAGERIRDKQFPIIFHGSRYAERLPIGKKEVLESFHHDTLRRFYQEWYRPELMAVVAVGDFDPAQIEKIIKDKFSRIPASAQKAQRPMMPVPGHTEMLFAIATDPEMTGTSISLNYKHDIKPQSKVLDYRRGMAQRLYGAMLNSRLQELTQKSNPPFIRAYNYYTNYVRTKDAYIMGAAVKDDGVLKGLEALVIEAERVKRHGFTESELDREKEDMLRDMEQSVMEKDKSYSSQYAAEFIRNFLEAEPIPGIELENEMYKKYMPGIALAEINKLTKEWMTEQNRVITLSGPEKAGLAMPTKEELTAVLEKVKGMDIPAYEDKVSKKPLVEKTPIPSKVVKTSAIPELQVTEWTLANGVRVILKPTDFKNDEIVMSAYSPGGGSLVPTNKYYSAMLGSLVLRECGVGDFDKTTFTKLMKGKVADVNASIGELEEGMSGSASPKDLEMFFQLLYLKFTQPRKDTAAFNSFTSRMKAVLENRSASPEAAWSDTLQVTLAQYHERAKPFGVHTIEAINVDDVLAMHRDRFADASDFTFVFVGNIDLEKMKPLVETYLGGLPSTKRKETWKDNGMRSPKGVINKTVVKGLADKSLVAIVFSSPFKWNREERYQVRALEEYLDMKLRESVREEKGGTYGINISLQIEKDPVSEFGAFIQFGCDPKRVEELTKTVFDVLDTVMTMEAGKDYVAKVQEIHRKERETSLKENGWWLGNLEYYYQNEEDPRLILKYEELINGLNGKKIQETAKKYLRMDNYVRVVLLPEGKKEDKKDGKEESELQGMK